jgi:type VII secretion protein EccB
MQSRRDQVQAYFFVVGRLVAALTHGKPDILETPNRRLSTGTVFGFLLAALLAAIFGIYGLFVPGGGTSWQQPGSIIVVKESGARYVYLDGLLRPVLNYTSARLAVGSNSTQVVSVSQSSLAGVPVGIPIGIPGAPDDLPAASGLDTGPWTVCVQDHPVEATGSGSPTITMLLRQLTAPALSQKQGMLVSTSDGSRYLLWSGHRYRIADPVVVEALGYGAAVPVNVPASWLDPLPVGRDLAVPTISGQGQPGPTIAGAPSVVGQVYAVSNPAMDTHEFYVVQSSGLQPLSRTAAALLLGSPSAQDANPGGRPTRVGPSALAGVSISSDTDLVTGYPPPLPEPALLGASNGTEPCASYRPSGGGNTEVDLLSLSPQEVDAGAVPAGQHVAGETADQVVIPGGSGVLAQDLPAPGAQPGTEYLITDIGVKYPLSSPSVASTLGYPPTAAVSIPGQLLALLPTGPALSPTAALANQVPGS